LATGEYRRPPGHVKAASRPYGIAYGEP